MNSRAPADDKLDEVLAELEAAREEPAWVPDEHHTPRRLVRPPAALESGRWTPSRSVIVLVIVCAALAAAIFGVRILLAPADNATAGSAPTSRVAVSSSGGGLVTALPSGPSGGSGAASSAPSTWSIHVVGAVNRPGVVTVSPGSRVADAVAAAGGLARQADASGINLARPLTDGEQVHVPRPGEKWTPPADAGTAPPEVPGAAGGTSSGGAATSGAGVSGTVNLNTAGKEEFDSLPGVGPVMAQRILDWRTEHGKFSSVDELGEVSGIGEKTLERLKPKVTV